MSQEYLSVDEALEQAIRLLTERFGVADQQAAVSLASMIYSCSARETFLEHRSEEPPYAGGQAQ